MQGLGDIVDNAIRTIGEMIDKSDKAIETKILDGVVLSFEEWEKLKTATEDAKKKREELFKLLNNADRDTK